MATATALKTDLTDDSDQDGSAPSASIPHRPRWDLSDFPLRTVSAWPERAEAIPSGTTALICPRTMMVARARNRSALIRIIRPIRFQSFYVFARSVLIRTLPFYPFSSVDICYASE